MPTRQHRDARIEFRLPSQWKRQIEQAAMVQNRSLTVFGAATLVETACKVLADHTQREHIQLSNRDRDRFLAMLDANAAPKRTLHAAARKHSGHIA